MNILIKTGKWILKAVLGFVAFVVIYLLCAEGLSSIKVNTIQAPPGNDSIEIFIKSNGVHTDIILPVKNQLTDWRKTFDVNTFEEVDSTYEYISFGWGDKGFFLETPTWADLKVSTAVKAAFFMSTTAMHVTYKKRVPRQSEECVRLFISTEQYKKLQGGIMNSFMKNKELVQKINHPGYGTDDNFYEANGTYSLFKTCNVWTGQQLDDCGIQVGWWTPFDRNVLASVRK